MRPVFDFAGQWINAVVQIDACPSIPEHETEAFEAALIIFPKSQSFLETTPGRRIGATGVRYSTVVMPGAERLFGFLSLAILISPDEPASFLSHTFGNNLGFFK